MKKNIVVLTGLLWCTYTHADIMPAVKIPAEFDESKYSVRIIEETSRIHYIKQLSDCNNIHYKDFFFMKLKSDIDGTPRNEPEKKPINEWLCLYSVDIYAEGFGSGLRERAIFSRDKSLWIIGKTNISDISSVYQNIPYKPI
ncbi:hypothetical protein OH773_11095 [Buttiauxella sp. WJP83]|uniref:hypothetical protein n=1 Tax=Buttiauxella sp. WJP83 TaxID=2986951 RepID=UPI0022DDF75F|nr:hypothetical protein [Buttiauxella sp. WJP83]WBM68762.1 hypothetical protein OH773_11095 [Buttiauxella sp. WJP83]